MRQWLASVRPSPLCLYPRVTDSSATTMPTRANRQGAVELGRARPLCFWRWRALCRWWGAGRGAAGRSPWKEGSLAAHPGKVPFQATPIPRRHGGTVLHSAGISRAPRPSNAQHHRSAANIQQSPFSFLLLLLYKPQHSHATVIQLALTAWPQSASTHQSVDRHQQQQQSVWTAAHHDARQRGVSLAIPAR